jgi:hypothetical protein
LRGPLVCPNLVDLLLDKQQTPSVKRFRLRTTWKNQFLLPLVLRNGRIQYEWAKKIEVVVLNQTHNERRPALNPFDASLFRKFPKQVFLAIVKIGLLIVPCGLD